MNFLDITIETDIKDYLDNKNDVCLVIYSQTSIDKIGLNINKNNFNCISTKELKNVKNDIEKFINDYDNFSEIICIGGGTAIDIGKYISFLTNKPLTCIPTMISTDAYATNKVALIVDGLKFTFDAVLPNKILLDKTVLNKSIENNLYGMADIFSIYTALNDWDLSIKYNYEESNSEYVNALNLLNETINYVMNNNIDLIKSNSKFIYKCVGEAGEITNRYGSGKPESGSEHIFAKALENVIKIPHAISVANGIILMSYAQSLFLDDKLDLNPCLALKKIGIYELNKKYNISFDLISKVFMNLTPREDRYTVVNLIYKNDELKKKVLDNYKLILEKIGCDD